MKKDELNDGAKNSNGVSRKHGPWTIYSSTQKYKNEWIELIEDQVTHPNGQPGIYGVLKMLPGVAVLPLDENGFVYLTKEFRYAIGRESIEVAGGGIDDGEDDLSSAKRELHEELGILAEDWIDLGVIDPFTNAIAATSHLFLARKLKFVSPEPESIEVIEMKKMKFEEAVEMVMKSKITHGPTCVLILKVREYLSEI